MKKLHKTKVNQQSVSSHILPSEIQAESDIQRINSLLLTESRTHQVTDKETDDCSYNKN